MSLMVKEESTMEIRKLSELNELGMRLKLYLKKEMFKAMLKKIFFKPNNVYF